jgi:hypothetical protein
LSKKKKKYEEEKINVKKTQKDSLRLTEKINSKKYINIILHVKPNNKHIMRAP